MKNNISLIILSLVLLQACYLDSRSRQESSNFPASVQNVDAVKLKNGYTSNDYTTTNLAHENGEVPLSTNSKKQLWEFWPSPTWTKEI